MKLRRSITYANVCSTLALVIAISGGTAWAASRIGSRQLANGAVVGRVLATGSVTSRAVKNHSLLAVDFKRGQLPRGPVGPAGAGALMDASWTLAEGVNGSTTTSFARTRTLGAFSLASAAIVDVRLTTTFAATAIGAGGRCLLQLRVDGKAADGTAPTDGSAVPEGTATLRVNDSSATSEAIAVEGWFRKLVPGRHTVEVWQDTTSAGTACDEPVDQALGQAFVTALH